MSVFIHSSSCRKNDRLTGHAAGGKKPQERDEDKASGVVLNQTGKGKAPKEEGMHGDEPPLHDEAAVGAVGAAGPEGCGHHRGDDPGAEDEPNLGFGKVQ